MSYFVLRQEDPTKRLEFIATRETREEAEAVVKDDAERTAAAVVNAEVSYLIVQGDLYLGYQGQATRANPPSHL